MNKSANIIERLSLCAGALLVAVAAIAWFDGVAHGSSAIEEFEGASRDSGSTLAILRIPSTGIEVAVFDSTSKTALNRGSGHVARTSLPGTAGNIAIAGHRDGFFRSLKDVEIGDEIELMALDTQQRFEVTETMIVDPLDVSVLDATDQTVLTLITCYPFYFVGPAPDRFIVRAIIKDTERGGQ